MKKKSSKTYIYLFLVFSFLVFLSVYYLFNGSKIGKRSDLVGDGICRNYAGEEEQDNCCANVHRDDVHEKCSGGWKFVEGRKSCQFLCGDSLPYCTKELKICRDKTAVSRNQSKECEFDECK